MLRTMLTATNTLAQVQTQLDNISNNIANSNTVGYKTKQANFSELLYQQYENDKLDRTVRQSPVGIRYGVGAQIAQIQSNEKQGALQNTNRDLDFAFSKPNQYFNVLMPNGEATRTAYTRQGSFYLSPIENGQVKLVTSEGYSVADANGNVITVPDNATAIRLGQDGILNVEYGDGEAIQVELAVTEMRKPQLMESLTGAYIGLPDNLIEEGFTEAEVLTDLQGQNREAIAMSQGVLEQSNVDLSKEMTDLIAAQRSYQFNAKAITISDQMLGLINGIR